MEIVLAVLVLSFLVFVFLAVAAVRATKRGIERAGAQARRTISDATLKARAAQPGASGELARIRRELRSSVDATRGVLEAGSQDDPALREALTLLDQLHGHARQLDGELGTLMQGEPDRSRITARLPELRQRGDRIKRSADALRHAAQDRANRYDRDELDSLHAQIDIEASALRHWAPAVPASEQEPELAPEPERRQLFRRKPARDAETE
ncbi:MULTISPECIES: hypothetical protein [unclassified Streptomyces]|uniref:hypothetical protein n=1 Tax=unclassified Streptomyces TaxID=2593676 RepID=UPI0015E196F7|nr:MULTISPECIES: hypothetical protein [unclassified Streptomyces]